MAMSYQPDSKIDSIDGGEYTFKVDAACEVTFKSGNRGCKLALLVGTPAGDVLVYDNLVYVPTALWKTQQCLQSLGLDFDNPPEVEELVNRTGRARFKRDERGYLAVDKYLPPEADQPEAAVPEALGREHDVPADPDGVLP